MANPVRMLALDELYDSQRPMTASELARTARTLPGSMRYHLGVLESCGLIHRVPGSDNRERPWIASALDYSIVASVGGTELDQQIIVDSRLHPQRARMRAALRLGAGPALRDDGYVVLNTGTVVLDEDERRRMVDEIDGVWAKYEELARGRGEDAEHRSVSFLWSALPTEFVRDRVYGADAGGADPVVAVAGEPAGDPLD